MTFINLFRIADSYVIVKNSPPAAPEIVVEKNFRDPIEALQVAKFFAEENKFPCISGIFYSKVPFVAPVRRGENWSPALIFHDKIRLITQIAGETIAPISTEYKEEERARVMAQKIASMESVCGIFLNSSFHLP